MLTGVNCLRIGGGLGGMHHQQSPLVVRNSAPVLLNCRIVLADFITRILLLHLFSFLLRFYYGGMSSGHSGDVEWEQHPEPIITQSSLL